MVQEIVELLVRNREDNPVFLDLTLGGGGHAEALLAASAPTGRVIGLDRDGEAMAFASARLARYGDRFYAVRGNFSTCDGVVPSDGVDGIVADLGVSSRQLDVAERGFSFQADGPLDMRMDQTGKTTAMSLVNEASEADLVRWFFDYGEERAARRVACAICRARRERPITRTSELAGIVRKAIASAQRGSRGRSRLDPATRVFQALRIVVNEELPQLEALLHGVPGLLRPHGRCAIISYHSLEDRLVKHRFRALAKDGMVTLVTKRPQRPRADEVRRNPRARSAKLRAMERCAP
ncbi:MAG: 16S rRNA (cytosine(1402)-N(4))-methyltransferase RsmH [Deltaproteobacteria bacterium]|nr:16S rRNA (cytosine(1402)-N(4))-methyltransferase RsmH [Deltaproteobacteria bacterium]